MEENVSGCFFSEHSVLTATVLNYYGKDSVTVQ